MVWDQENVVYSSDIVYKWEKLTYTVTSMLVFFMQNSKILIIGIKLNLFIYLGMFKGGAACRWCYWCYYLPAPGMPPSPSPLYWRHPCHGFLAPSSLGTIAFRSCCRFRSCWENGSWIFLDWCTAWTYPAKTSAVSNTEPGRPLKAG